jgi:putative membrane protein
MRLDLDSRLAIIANTSLFVLFVACSSEPDGAARTPASRTIAAPSSAAVEAGGEVAPDSARPVVRWINDANVLAIAAAMNYKQLAAADAELSTWHVDTVRAFAAAMAREHSAMQRTMDSLAGALQIVPVKPALATLVQLRMQRQIDSIYMHGGRAFDRAFLDQQIASHRLMQDYLGRLAAVAERSALRQVLTTAADSVRSQTARAVELRTMFAKQDSAAADSAAKREARRAARLKRPTG